MPVISDKPLQRVCIRLWKDDYEALGKMADMHGEVGRNMLIRTIVHSYVVQMKAAERKNLDKLAASTEPTSEAAQ